MEHFQLHNYNSKLVPRLLLLDAAQKMQSTENASHECQQKHFEQRDSGRMNAVRKNFKQLITLHFISIQWMTTVVLTAIFF